MLDLARHIWNGHDYLPHVWSGWLANPANHLYVGLWGNELAGTINLKHLGPGQWFLEGLRVHPKFQGRKFSSYLFEYALQDWCSQPERGELRLITSSQRKVVHHLCDRLGFEKIGEIRWFTGAPLHDQANDLRALTPAETEQALVTLTNNPLVPPGLNLMDLGWEFSRPQRQWVADAIQTGQALAWREGRGYVTLFFDEDEGQKLPFISSIACPPAELPALLTDSRRWAGQMGYPAIYWNVILLPQTLAALATTGFSTPEEENSLFLYEKK
jgi:GNAT superfamily N-acetyltransferase